MKTNPLFQSKESDIDPTSTKAIEDDAYPFQHDPNITEGGEFLDDAIRTKDQPLYESTEKENR